MRGTARFEHTNGSAAELYFEGGDHVASQLADTKHVGTWNGTSYTLTFAKNFRWRMTVALPADVTFSYTEAASLRRLALVDTGQSNAEGRGSTVDAPAVANATRILRNIYPYDENHGGPGAPALVGPMLLLADKIMDRGQYDRAYIVSASTSTQSVAALYGSNGDDGTYAVQRDTADVCGGKSTANPPPILHPGDAAVLVYAQGESDTNPAPADWSASVQTLLNHIMDTDFPGVTWLGVLVSRFGPAAPDDLVPSVSHPDWLVIRAEQAQLAAPAGTPPQVVVDYEDADRIVGDGAHIATGVSDAVGWRRWTTAAVAALVANGVIE